jgi:uridine phosphorylase
MLTLDKAKKTMGRMQYHIRCQPGDVGAIVLLPGDPARVVRIAKYLKDAREVASNREFLTYAGWYEGVRISATSTGIGCPSAAIAVEELANIGARLFIRVGSTGALQDDMGIGDLVIATGAMKGEGTSRFYAPETLPAVPDLEVTKALVDAARELATEQGFRVHVGLVASDDAFYGETPEYIEELHRLRVLSVEMEASAIFTVCHMRGLLGGMIAAVSGNLHTGEVVYEEDNQKLIIGWEHEIQVALRAVKKLSDSSVLDKSRDSGRTKDSRGKRSG